MGVYTVCTELRHWSEGRPVTSVPDVEGDLSGDRRQERKGRTPISAVSVRKDELSPGKADSIRLNLVQTVLD